MSTESREILGSIKNGESIKPPRDFVGLGNAEYYISIHGHVYSLNGESPHEVERKEGWHGLLWVTLLTSDGYSTFSVAELVARTHMWGELAELPGGDDEYIVGFKDGDRNNCAASNLRWINRLDAADQDRTEQGKETKAERLLEEQIKKDDEQVEIVEPDEQLDDKALAKEMVERVRVMSGKMQLQNKQFMQMMKAVQPFMAFELSQKHRHGAVEMVVLEANRGRPEHSVLKVGDFARLKDAMKEVEDLEE